MAVSLLGLSLLAVGIFSVVPCDTVSLVLPTVVSAVGKIVQHYKRNFHELNLDGLFGLRVVEGQLMMLTDEHALGRLQHIPADIIEFIHHYRTITSEVSRRAITAVKEDDEEYYNSMAFVVAQPWIFHNQHRKIDSSLRWDGSVYKSSIKAELSESTSDGCMGELTGNSITKTKGCQISKKCVEIMTLKGLTSYGITHQLLWSMLGEKAGCRKQLEQILSQTEYKSLERLRLEFCTNNYFEMHELIDDFLNGTITPKYQDLFLEQQFVCPNLGFGEFLSLDFLKDILSWQKEDGCFGKMPRVANPRYANIPKFEKIKKALDSDYDYDEDAMADLQQLQQRVSNVVKMEAGDEDSNVKPAEPNSKMKFKKEVLGNGVHLHSHDSNLPVKSSQERQNVGQNQGGVRKPPAVDGDNRPLVVQQDNYAVRNGPRRKLLVEKEMSGGCLSHKTAVAAGALVMYLRYLIDPGDTGLDKGTGSIKLVDPGKKRDILQKEIGLGEGPRQHQQPDSLMDRGNPYQNEEGDEGDDDEDDDYNDGDEEEDYGNDGEAKLAGRNLIHIKRLGPGEKSKQELYDRAKEPADNNNDEEEDYKGDNQQTNDEEYPYYDETEEDKKLKGKHLKDLPVGVKHDRPAKSSMKPVPEVKGTERTMVIIFLACFVVLFLFMFRFIKKRRIHIRYHTRTLFGL